jgi:hypothetical protein
VQTNQGLIIFLAISLNTMRINHYGFFVENEEMVKLPIKCVNVGKFGGVMQPNRGFMLAIYLQKRRFSLLKRTKINLFPFFISCCPHANNERRAAFKRCEEVPDYGIYSNKDWTYPK